MTDHYRFLDEPRVEFSRDQNGRITAMYMKVREGKSVGAVQPNPNALVYFYLAPDGLPVGIKFLEPVAGVAITEVVDKLYRGPDGRPAGVETQAVHRFLAEKDLRKIIEAMYRGIDQLEPATG